MIANPSSLEKKPPTPKTIKDLQGFQMLQNDIINPLSTPTTINMMRKPTGSTSFSTSTNFLHSSLCVEDFTGSLGTPMVNASLFGHNASSRGRFGRR